jgi:predicted RNA-binding Zn ribbon-like protein
MPSSLPHEFEFSGGDLCLDFANTIGSRPHGDEHLHSWLDLVVWADQAGLLEERAIPGLRERLEGEGRSTARAFLRALAMREGLYRIFGSMAAGGRPDPADLEAFNAALAVAMRDARVVPGDGNLTWGWSGPARSLDDLLRPVLRSAAELLVSSRQSDVRECASGTCSWLFLDGSRARRRRWCSMKVCGNRAKVRRYYGRRRGELTGSM